MMSVVCFEAVAMHLLLTDRSCKFILVVLLYGTKVRPVWDK